MTLGKLPPVQCLPGRSNDERARGHELVKKGRSSFCLVLRTHIERGTAIFAETLPGFSY